MDADSLFASILQTANEILTSAIVVIAFSLLLYNLTRNLRNRVARSSGIVLACVTLPYVCDAFLSLRPSPEVYAMTLRLQWIGIAYVPAALFHLSDALLATTGLPSRGRRRRVVALLYLISTLFFAAAAGTDLLIEPVRLGVRYSIRAGDLFWLYLLYFLIISAAVFINLQRARRRCLTRSTARRMSYLQLAILTPSLGVFPFSALLNPGDEFSIPALLLVNVANIIIIIMLIFLSYPLSFFGSSTPDRAVKIDLLRFLLRGPGTGLLALAIIILTQDATRILSLPGEDFMPFAVVAVVLLWQWTIALIMPWLERVLVYGRNTEEEEELTRLQTLAERIQTKADLNQHLEGMLSACCDLLRTEVAYVLSVRDESLEIVQAVGTPHVSLDLLTARRAEFEEFLSPSLTGADRITHIWEGAPVFPLFSRRTGYDEVKVIGLLIIETTPNHLRLEKEEHELLQQYLLRIEQTLDDLALLTEVYAALEGLLPQIIEGERKPEMDYRPGTKTKATVYLPDKEELQEQVHAALKDYWGGPGMAKSRLMDLQVVQTAMQTTDNPINALRNVLQQAVEGLRPSSERAMTSPEWTQYNIVELRYLEGRKVSDVARRMNISEADLYRKQRRAIETITDTLLRMEASIQQRQANMS